MTLGGVWATGPETSTYGLRAASGTESFETSEMRETRQRKESENPQTTRSRQ